MLANRTVHIFNNNVMMHFRKILQPRQKRLILDKFLVKNGRKATAEEEESTGSLSHRREKNARIFLPSLSMEGDSRLKKGMLGNKVLNKANYYALLLCFALLCMHCILICFINTHNFQIIYNYIDVSRHSSECIDRLLTISYGKYCLTF